MEHKIYPKHCRSTLAAETVGTINELLTEILVRVPARPLVRFKSVSKHWLSVISDPEFCHRHTLRNPNTPASAVFHDSSITRGFIPLPLDDHYCRSDSPINPLNIFQDQYNDYFKVIQSCNGLFLCQLLDAKQSPAYIILNPTTNQFSTLMPPTTVVTNEAGKQVEPYIISIALVFDPSKSPHYKAVCLRTIEDGPEPGLSFRILIYSSETRSWRLLDSSFSGNLRIDYREVVFCNGAIHWVGLECDYSYFHVDEELTGYLPPPPCSIEKVWSRRVYRYFRESGDQRHLHLIDIYRPCICNFEVLEMGENYSGWFVKYIVDLDPIFTVDTWFLVDRVRILFLAQDENEGGECSSLLLHIPGKAFSYDLKSKTAKSFDLTPMTDLDDCLLRVGYKNYRYIESLACV